MSSLFNKVRDKSSSREPGDDRGNLSRSSSLRSTLSRTFSRKEKKNKSKMTGDETATPQRSEEKVKKSSRTSLTIEVRSTSGNVSLQVENAAQFESDPNVQKDDHNVGDPGAINKNVLVKQSMELAGGSGDRKQENIEQLEDRNAHDEELTIDKHCVGSLQNEAKPPSGNHPSRDFLSSPLSPRKVEEDDGLSQQKINILPDLIQASSTPIQDTHTGNEDTSQQFHIDLGELEGEASETTPLISQRAGLGYTDLENWGDLDDGEPFHSGNGICDRAYDFLFRENPWSTFFIAFLLVLIFVIIVCTLAQVGELLNQAVLPDIQSVSILDVTDTGMSLHIVGSIYVEYEQISNSVFRSVLKLGGLMIGSVTIVPKHGCKVFVSGANISRAHALDIFPPELSVDLIDRRITELDFISEAELIQDDIVELAQSLMQHDRLEPLRLDIEVVIDSLVQGKWFYYNTHPISIFHRLVLEPGDMNIPLQIDDLEVNIGENSVDLNVVASTLRELPVKFKLNSFEWDVALSDCEKQPIILGKWITDAVDLKPDLRAEINIHGDIEKIPDALLEECSDGLSPFNKFTNKLMGENKLSVLLKARKSKLNEENLPSWLYNILSSTLYSIDVPVRTSELDYTHLLANYTMEGVSLTLPSDSSGLSAQIGANLSIDLLLPFKATNLQASISEVIANFTILEGISDILEIELERDNYIGLSNPENSLTGSLSVKAKDVNVEVLSPLEVGKLLNELINDVELIIPQWNFDLELAVLKLPIVSTTIRHLKVQHRSGNYTLSSFSDSQRDEGLFDRLLRMMNVNIDQILYLRSNKTHVELLVDFKVTNPVNVLLSVPDDTISLDYLYNKSAIGTVMLKNVLIPAGVEDYNMSASMSISCQDDTQRIFAEEFVSKVISAAEGIKLGIKGHKMSSKKNPALGALLSQIELDDLKFPPIRFENGEDDELATILDDDSPASRKSPFLIDATIHVLTSEIELTVFNPLSNAELVVEIEKCQASYKGEALANIERSELMLIPPGIYKTPRIPIKVAQGIGADILRRAMNGNLFVEVTAELGVRIDKFTIQLLYHGEGLTADVKL